MLSWLYTEAPNRDEVLVNDRIHVGMPGAHGDLYSTEYHDVPGFGEAHPWEENRGIGGSYGYNRAEGAPDYASANEILADLVRTVGLGGNFLLDVGPTADGRIDPIQQQRLLEIGAWMDLNRDAVYGARPSASVRSHDPDVFVTEHDGTVYALITGAPGRAVTLVSSAGRLTAVEPLDPHSQLAIEVERDHVTVTIPEPPFTSSTDRAMTPVVLGLRTT